METVKDWWLTRVMMEEGKNRQSTENIEDTENIFCMIYTEYILQGNACPYTFVKPHRMNNTKSEP